MKVFFETGVDSGHDVRGIGVHTKELIKHLNKIETENENRADIVHFTYFKPFERTIVPFFKLRSPACAGRQKWVLTIHDLIALIYPKHYPPGIKGKMKFILNKFIIKKNIDAIITISETSKKDICRFLKIDPKKVFVSYLGFEKEYKKMIDHKKLNRVKNKYKLPDKFVFYIGDVNYNKNIPTLVNACRKLDITLVIGGKHAQEVEKMDLNHPEHRHLKGLDFSNVKRLGYISSEDANSLYNLAVLYVQPSFYEGFGLPVIQGFASGCPVVAAKTQSLVEIGKDACVYFDPKRSKDLEEKIKYVIWDSEVKREYIKKGLERSKLFSWKKCADETYEIYKKTLEK